MSYIFIINIIKTNIFYLNNKYKNIVDFIILKILVFKIYSVYIYMLNFIKIERYIKTNKTKLIILIIIIKKSFIILLKKLIDFIISDRYIIIDKITFNFDQIFAKFDREFKTKIEILNLKFVIEILNFKFYFSRFIYNLSI